MTEEEFRFQDKRSPSAVEAWPALDLTASRDLSKRLGDAGFARDNLPPGTSIRYVDDNGVEHSAVVGPDGKTLITDTDMKRRKEILQGNFYLHVRRARDKTFGGVKDRLTEVLEAAKTAREYFNLTGESIVK